MGRRDDGGWIVSHRSGAAAAIRKAVENVLLKFGYDGVTPVYKECNVYNVYIRTRKQEMSFQRGFEKTWKRQSAWSRHDDMCPASEGGSASGSGGRRQGVRP